MIKSSCKGFAETLVCQATGQNTTAEREANAALIVRAVNSHDALMKALNDLVKACDRYDERPDSDVCVSIYMEARDKARSALALEQDRVGGDRG